MSIPVKSVFNCLSGNTGLTEEFIYNNLQSSGDNYKVLSGSTINGKDLGIIPVSKSNDLNIKVFVDKPGILVTRKGKAGQMRYIPPGKYTLNDDAYILYLRDEFRQENGIHTKEEESWFLKWFVPVYKAELLEYSSSNDNSTWNKTGYFKNSAISLPTKKDMKNIGLKFEQLILLKEKTHLALEYLESFQRKLNFAVENKQVYRLKTLFDLNQGHQITDEELYYTEGNIPVLTGNNEIKGYWNKSIVTPNCLPCLSYPTKANPGVVYKQCKNFDANNTAVLIPKKEWRDKIVLDWFTYKLPFLFLESMTSNEGVSYLNKDIIQEIEIELPEKEEQDKELEIFRRISKAKNDLLYALNLIDEIFSKQII